MSVNKDKVSKFNWTAKEYFSKYCDVKIDKTLKPTHDLSEEQQKIMKIYPMLHFVFIDSPTERVKSGLDAKKIENYVNSVDLNLTRTQKIV